MILPRGLEKEDDEQPEYLGLYLDAPLVSKMHHLPKPAVAMKFTVHHSTHPEANLMKGETGGLILVIKAGESATEKSWVCHAVVKAGKAGCSEQSRLRPPPQT